MDRRIKFRHLEAFVAIARAKRLKTAAEQLNLTQPAISKSLKDLEDILGVRLMQRDRAGVELTPEGKIFMQFAEQSTVALTQGLHKIAALNEAGGEVLRIGVLPAVAGEVLPAAVARFRAISRHTTVRIEEGPHEHLAEMLRAGGVDLVIGRLADREMMEGLSFTALYTETVVAVAAPDHPKRAATRLEELMEELILYPPDTAAIRPFMARLMLSQGLPLFAKRIETVSAAFGRAAVLGPMRPIWIVSQGVVRDDLADGTLVALDIDMTPAQGPVGVMSRISETPSTLASVFRDALSDAAEMAQPI